MRVVRTRAELAAARAELDQDRDQRVAVVMTMGALHDGHQALLRAARAGADHVVVTIFVNPLQFGPNEDLDRYPRTLEADLARCAQAGVDLVFVPDVAELYPTGEPQVRVNPGPLGERLEGASRPGFFHGVLTVVLKLLHLVRPHVAYFGEKDYQQLTLVRQMVRDLDLDVEIVGVPTVREPDGLALSSRNRYLSAQERATALRLSAALRAGAEAAGAGTEAALSAAHRAFDLGTPHPAGASSPMAAGEAQAAEGLAAEGLVAESPVAGGAAAEGGLAGDGAADAPGVRLDYLVLTDPDLGPAPTEGPARLLVAAWVGTTRLIDNAPIQLGAAAAASAQPASTGPAVDPAAVVNPAAAAQLTSARDGRPPQAP